MLKKITIKRTENTTPYSNWDYIAYVEDDCEDGQFLVSGLGSNRENALKSFLDQVDDDNVYEVGG
jgi:hypothetical protein